MNLTNIKVRSIIREAQAAEFASRDHGPSMTYLLEDLMAAVNEFRLSGDIAAAAIVDDKAAYIVSAYGKEYLPVDRVSIEELLRIGEVADGSL